MLCRPRISLVCKRWHELFFTLPSLWRVVVLNWAGAREQRQVQGWLAAARSLLHRLGSIAQIVALEFFEVYTDQEWRQALGTLDWLPLSLPSLDIRLTGDGAAAWPPAGASLAQLTRLSHLTYLRMDTGELQAQIISCLPHLPQLASFTYETAHIPIWPSLASALAQHTPGLTQLELAADYAEEPMAPAALSPLTALTHLQSLTLMGTPLPSSAVEVVACLTQLTHVWLSDLDGGQPVDLTPLASLQRMQHLWLDFNREGAAPLPPLEEMLALQRFTFRGALATGNAKVGGRGGEAKWVGRWVSGWAGPSEDIPD